MSGNPVKCGCGCTPNLGFRNSIDGFSTVATISCNGCGLMLVVDGGYSMGDTKLGELIVGKWNTALSKPV